MCPNCSVSLTVHSYREEHTLSDTQNLLCHYCGHQQGNPTTCSQCKVSAKDLIKKGIGTQQITAAIQKLFPHAVVARADLDTAKKKRQWYETIDRLQRGEIDILVGTQLITKGYHFPRVSLVGIIWADLNLHFPVFDAGETTLQKLIQVAGRSGRSGLKSTVIVQSLADYPILKYISEETYPLFCAEELEFRRQAGYPPFKRLTYIELKHTEEITVDQDAENVAEQLRAMCEKYQIPITILGPSKPMIHRIQKTESRIILLKSDTFQQVHHVIKSLSTDGIESGLFITPHQ
jgi:primosomal protein N' (replication factor Y)